MPWTTPSDLLRHARSPRRNLAHELLAPLRSLGHPLAQAHEIHLARVAVAVVKRAEASVRLRHHVKRQPRAVRFAVAIPVLEFVLAKTLDRLRQTVRHRV